MPQSYKTKKGALPPGLVRRTLWGCLALLILPLFIHTFLLYIREVRLEEEIVRTDLQAIGAEMARRIATQVELDQQISGGDAPVRIEGEALVVGAISHPLSELLSLQPPPSFPVDASFGSERDQWVEVFPIPNTNLVLALGTSSERISNLQWSHLLFRVGSFLLLVGIIGGGAYYFLLCKLSHPFDALRRTMQRVAEGDVHKRYAVHKWGFEINAIGTHFNATVDALLLHQNQAETEKIRRETLARELHLGRSIQAGLLPKKFPHLFDIGAECLPAREVGGDFYDVFSYGSGGLLIAVADVAGKGIAAALFSLGLRSSLRALAATTGDVPQLLQKANELFLLDAGDTGEFATLWLAVLKGQTLHYASCGHPPALLKRQGALQQLSTDHPALGLMPLEAPSAQTCELKPGDELLIYSDGITETHNAQGHLFGPDRLKSAFLQCEGERAQSTVACILRDVERFGGGAPQHDDLTLLVIRG